MYDNLECLGDIEELEEIIQCKKNMKRFKTLGIRNKVKPITKEEQLNRRVYRELYHYKLYNY